MMPWLIALLLLPNAAGALDFGRQGVGTAGAEFLNQDVGSRGIALGGAYSAVTNDVYSLYWNPAGLSKIPRLSAGFAYSRYVADINYQSGHVAGRINESGVLAGGFRYRDIGSIDHTDISGNTVGKFRPRDYVAEIGWGQSILDLSDSEVDVTMGVTGRWLHSDYMLHADGYGGDLGIQSRFYTTRYTYDVSFVAQNIGVGQKFDKTRDTLPFRAKLGGAVQIIKPLLLSVEAILPINNIVHGAAGAEYSLEASRDVKLAFRGGFNSLTIDSLGFQTAMSAGIGLKVGRMSFDYAFVPLGVLGADTHRFSVTFDLPAKASRRYRER